MQSFLATNDAALLQEASGVGSYLTVLYQQLASAQSEYALLQSMTLDQNLLLEQDRVRRAMAGDAVRANGVRAGGESAGQRRPGRAVRFVCAQHDRHGVSDHQTADPVVEGADEPVCRISQAEASADGGLEPAVGRVGTDAGHLPGAKRGTIGRQEERDGAANHKSRQSDQTMGRHQSGSVPQERAIRTLEGQIGPHPNPLRLPARHAANSGRQQGHQPGNRHHLPTQPAMRSRTKRWSGKDCRLRRWSAWFWAWSSCCCWTAWTTG